MKSILIICAGNICRSPAIAAALQKIVQEKGLTKDVTIDSCAITSWFLGAPADPRMVAAAHKKGIHIDHKAKLFEEGYFKLFDHLIAVDSSVLKTLQSMAKTDAERAKLHLATDFSPTYKGQDMPDPYYDGETLFDKIMEMSLEIAQGIFTQLIQK